MEAKYQRQNDALVDKVCVTVEQVMYKQKF